MENSKLIIFRKLKKLQSFQKPREFRWSSHNDDIFSKSRPQIFGAPIQRLEHSVHHAHLVDADVRGTETFLSALKEEEPNSKAFKNFYNFSYFLLGF